MDTDNSAVKACDGAGGWVEGDKDGREIGTSIILSTI